MMEGYDNYQLELFREQTGRGPSRPRGNRFFFFLRRQEKKLLLAIAVAACCILSFSLGVSKGRQAPCAVSGGRSTFDLAKEDKPAKAAAPPIKQVQREQKNLPPQPPPQLLPAAETVKEDLSQVYTIQLASYRAKKSAEMQAEELKKKGLAPLVLQKGEYIILCVGRFSGKSEARNSLTKFKKQYKDCYLRRL